MPQSAGCPAGPGHTQHNTGKLCHRQLQGPYQLTYVLFVQLCVDFTVSTNGCSLLCDASGYKVESQVQHAQLMQQLQHCRERLERHRELCCVLTHA